MSRPGGRPLGSVPCLVALGLALTACSPGESRWRDKVDCSGLPRLPERMTTAVEAGKAPFTDADLEPGEARIALRWSDASGDLVLRSRPRHVADVLYKPYDSNFPDWGPAWVVGIPLHCDPSAAAFVEFVPADGSQEPLTPGAYRVRGVGFDVPDLEQGEGGAPQEVSGEMVITEAGAGESSGYLRGWGHTGLRSYIFDQPVDVEIEIVAFAFREIPTQWVADDSHP